MSIENLPYNEKELLHGLADGDQVAFRQIFELLLRPLCFFAEKLIGQKEEAEDAASIAFQKLWQRRNDFSSLTAVRSFLYTTVRNQCLDILRHRAVVTTVQQQMANSQEQNELSIEAQMYQAELLRIVYQNIKELPDRYRHILEYSFLENQSTAEIAARLQLSENHVRADKSRAIALLRTILRNPFLLELIFLYY